MDASDFTEDEHTITTYAKTFKTALDVKPQYAELVGHITNLFAGIEGYAPMFLERIMSFNPAYARATLGVFLSFTNKIEMLTAIYKTFDEKTPEYIIGKHVVSLFKTANKIRNRYAHAQYGLTKNEKGEEAIAVREYPGAYNRKTITIKQQEKDFIADIQKLKLIHCELNSLILARKIRAGLHRELQKPVP